MAGFTGRPGNQPHIVRHRVLRRWLAEAEMFELKLEVGPGVAARHRSLRTRRPRIYEDAALRVADVHGAHRGADRAVGVRHANAPRLISRLVGGTGRGGTRPRAAALNPIII